VTEPASDVVVAGGTVVVVAGTVVVVTSGTVVVVGGTDVVVVACVVVPAGCDPDVVVSASPPHAAAATSRARTMAVLPIDSSRHVRSPRQR
jgi:hypothetical protein